MGFINKAYSLLTLPVEVSLRTIPEAARAVEGVSNYAAQKIARHYQNNPSNNLLYNSSIILSCMTLSETNKLARNFRSFVTDTIDDKFNHPSKS